MHTTRMPSTSAEDQVVSQHFFTAAQGDAKAQEDGAFVNGSLNGEQARPIPASLHLLTICVLVLRNGFVVTGEAFCSDPLAFDAETGRKLARGRALDKVWPLLGYALCSELARPVLTEADAAADLAGTPRPGQPG